MTITVQPVLTTHIVHQRYKKDREENKHDPEIVKLREREKKMEKKQKTIINHGVATRGLKIC